MNLRSAAFAVLMLLHLAAIALVFVLVMPVLLLARGLIVVCTEASIRPVRAAVVILALAWLAFASVGGVA